jgi:D-alanyl-D-alanine carboxypeptidase/D-alanyl-D-alanine-endopeptidase (penicillin-binding protein 4)
MDRSGIAALVIALLVPLALPSDEAAAPGAGAGSRWEALIKKHGFRADQVGFLALDAEGNTRAAIYPDAAFVPASNQKVLVAAAALAQLGLDHRFQTLLWSDRPPSGAELPGDLTVSGSGDPNISGRFTGNDPTAIFRDWAREFRAKGIRRIRGDLLIDDFAFDDERFLASWKSNQKNLWYSAQIGALSLNDNCIDVTVKPTRIGKEAAARISPATAYVSLENRAKTVEVGDPALSLNRLPGGNRIVLRGRMPSTAAAGWTGSVTIDDPGLFFGTVLKEVFAAEGVAIDGRVVRDRARLAPEEKRIPLHRHLSPLALDLPVILSNSQNLHAELLLKALGARRGETGSVASGARSITEFLLRERIPSGALVVADGSGFSPENRIAAATLARVLQWVSRQECFSAFLKSLAVGGRSGTLHRRFRAAPLRGRVIAKTGYINNVSTLSGFLSANEIEPRSDADPRSGPAIDPRTCWVFSILINGFPAGGWLGDAHQLQEALLLELHRAAFSSEPAR